MDGKMQKKKKKCVNFLNFFLNFICTLFENVRCVTFYYRYDLQKKKKEELRTLKSEQWGIRLFFIYTYSVTEYSKINVL